MKNLQGHQWAGQDKKKSDASRKRAERVLAGENLQQVLEIPQTTVEQFYDFAQDLLLEKRFEDSAAVLFVISLINPGLPAVWLSYGICHHHIKNLNVALSAYQQASLLNPELIKPYVYASQCAIGLGDLDGAINLLMSMDNFGKPEDDDQDALTLANHLKEELTHGKKNTA